MPPVLKNASDRMMAELTVPIISPIVTALAGIPCKNGRDEALRCLRQALSGAILPGPPDGRELRDRDDSEGGRVRQQQRQDLNRVRTKDRSGLIDPCQSAADDQSEDR